jgi:hypothetical protein
MLQIKFVYKKRVHILLLGLFKDRLLQYLVEI